jgi:hypothetical protein
MTHTHAIYAVATILVGLIGYVFWNTSWSILMP